MAWFKKKNKQRTVPEALTLSAENIVSTDPNNQDALLNKISTDLQIRLENELGSILNDVVDSTINEAHDEIATLLHRRLKEKLSSKLDSLVEQAIKLHFTKPPTD